ncbi:MAG: DUF294 nucleotidyltransferase-like domain-containing protein [Mucilaginibacter sp.]
MKDRLEFLKTVAPFNLLPEDVLKGVAEQLHKVSYDADKIIYQQEVTKLKGVDIIFKGHYESFFYDNAQNKRLIEIHGPGFCYGGVSVLLNRRQSLRTVIAAKGTVIYFLHRKDFRLLCKTYENFFQHFSSEFGKRMQNEEFVHFFKKPATFEESYMAADQLYSRKIESVEQRAIVSCPGTTSIYKVAQTMATHKVSCLFVTDENGKMMGYVTDITLRDKVIGLQINPQEAVSTVMESPVVSVDVSAYMYEAILMMFQTKTRYLLVKKGDDYIGFLSRNKLLSEQAQSPLIFIQSVKSAVSAQELKKKWEAVPAFVNQLLQRGVHAHIANRVITTIADTIALKVIEQAIELLGQPPAKFVFIVLGSEGRKEQTFKTDQDNAIIYEDKANEHREEVREYFLNFATQVSERLNEIGFVFCTGGYMAQNPKWTHSLSHWKRNYEHWMDESLPETVINFSTFFDCRTIYGDESIMDELHDFLNEMLQKPQDKLFYNMTINALQYEPPLTFFNSIRTFTKDEKEVFDIKKAMTPIVDLVRVYALKYLIFEQNTGDRMKILKEKGVFTEAQYYELNQAYYFLMNIRLKKQSIQLMQDRTDPDNYMDISALSKIERVTLKEVFKVIKNFQSKIKLEFTNSLLS